MTRIGLLLGVTAMLVGATISGSAPSVRAQDESLRINLGSVTAGEYPNAIAVFNTEDTAAGGAPAELTPENVSVTIDGKPVTVQSVQLASSEDSPLHLGIVIDTSGSMEGAPIAAAREAAKALVAQLGPNDHVAIVGFGDDVTQHLDFTTDRAAAIAAIDGLRALGNTALYQATAVGAVKVASSTASRRAVILLSDGADFGGRSIATRAEALAAAAGTGVPFFVVAQGSDLDRAFLNELATATKGRYLEAPNPEDLQALYLGIGRLLKSQYIVNFDASSVAGVAEAQVAVTVKLGERTASDQTAFRPPASFLPGVTIDGLVAGENIAEKRELSVSVAGDVIVPASVEWFVDGVSVAESTSAPFAFAFDPADYGEGAHVLGVEVDVGAAPVVQQVDFSSTPPVAASGGGGLPIVPIGLGVVVVAVLLVGGVLFLRARARAKGPRGIPVNQRLTPWAATPRAEAAPDGVVRIEEAQQEEIGELMGTLISRSGPDLGSEYAVGSNPVRIGSGARCGVRVNDPELSMEEARIWVRGGHLMLHKLTKLNDMTADGTTGGWSILESGDVFSIHNHEFQFKLLDKGGATPAEPAGPVNILKEKPSPSPSLDGARAPIARVDPSNTPPSLPRPATAAADGPPADAPAAQPAPPTPPAAPAEPAAPGEPSGTPGADAPKRLTDMMPRDADGMRRKPD